MYQKDYLMRLIEQFIQGLLQVLFHIESGQTVQAEDSLGKLYTSSLGLSRETVAQMSDEQIVVLFGGKDVIGSDKCIMLAELFYAETRLLPASIPGDQYSDLACRSLYYYLLTLKKTTMWNDTEFHEHFLDLVGTLEYSKIPTNQLIQLSDYYSSINDKYHQNEVSKELSIRE